MFASQPSPPFGLPSHVRELNIRPPSDTIDLLLDFMRIVTGRFEVLKIDLRTDEEKLKASRFVGVTHVDAMLDSESVRQR